MGLERKGCKKIGEVENNELFVCNKTGWKPVGYKEYKRNDIWYYRDDKGYEIGIMINPMPKDLKEKGVKENYLIILYEPYSAPRTLDSFKTKQEALDFVMDWMEKHPEGLGKQYGEWMLGKETQPINPKKINKNEQIQLEREGQVFGIYELDGEYYISDGHNLYYLFDGISYIDEDVDIGISHKAKLTNYNLRVTPTQWIIYDSATNKIIKEGRAVGDFFNSVRIFKNNLL